MKNGGFIHFQSHLSRRDYSYYSHPAGIGRLSIHHPQTYWLSRLLLLAASLP